MRIAVFGAGAVGSMIAARLARIEADVTLIARGERLAALRAHGLTYIEKEERFTTYPSLSDDTRSCGTFDAVILALKAHQIEAALPDILPLIGSETLIVPAINGLPWWFFEGRDSPRGESTIRTVDPTGRLAAALPAHQIVGCVVYVAAETHPPASVESAGIRKLVIGPAVADSGLDDHITALADTLENAGFYARITTDIRTEVWLKLWGNIWANPLSVATGMTMRDLYDDPAIYAVALDILKESAQVAERLGITLPMDAETRLSGGAKLGHFKTSMLQDFERGRAIELDAILGAVIEIADRLEIPVPTLKCVYALTRARAKTHGCYGPPS